MSDNIAANNMIFLIFLASYVSLTTPASRYYLRSYLQQGGSASTKRSKCRTLVGGATDKAEVRPAPSEGQGQVAPLFTELPRASILGNYGVQTEICLSPTAIKNGGPYVAWDYGHSVCP